MTTPLAAKFPLFCQAYSRTALLQFLTLISPSFSVLLKNKYLNAVFVMVGPEVQNYLLLTSSSSFQSQFPKLLTLSIYVLKAIFTVTSVKSSSFLSCIPSLAPSIFQPFQINTPVSLEVTSMIFPECTNKSNQVNLTVLFGPLLCEFP